MNLALAILFFIVSLIKLRGKQAEHFFTRFIASLWFFVISYDSGVPTSIQHTVSTSIICIILSIEIISPMFRWYWRGRK